MARSPLAGQGEHAPLSGVPANAVAKGHVPIWFSGEGW